MKRAVSFIAISSFLVLFAMPARAFECPGLIKEGKGLLASSKLSQAEQKKVKALLDESQKLHDSGNHDESTKKANEALSLLGKK